MNLQLKIIFTALFVLGTMNPKQFIKITEFWRVKMQREPSELSIKLTRVLSSVAIVLLWTMV